MSKKISKSNEGWESVNARLDEVRLASHDRLKARAHMARAEAFADALAWLFALVRRLVRPAAGGRPYGGPSASAG